tara:strand:- start:1258 stop:1470 length:213 start_codon:yes stop_codon:yes gene_type:complete
MEMLDMTIAALSFGIPVLLSLYLMIRNVEYRESIRRLQKDLEQTKQANRNLAQIIQDEIQKQVEFEEHCG